QLSPNLLDIPILTGFVSCPFSADHEARQKSFSAASEGQIARELIQRSGKNRRAERLIIELTSASPLASSRLHGQLAVAVKIRRRAQALRPHSSDEAPYLPAYCSLLF